MNCQRGNVRRRASETRLVEVEDVDMRSSFTIILYPPNRRRGTSEEKPRGGTGLGIVRQLPQPTVDVVGYGFWQGIRVVDHQ